MKNEKKLKANSQKPKTKKNKHMKSKINYFTVVFLAIITLSACTQEQSAQNVKNTSENIVFAVPFAPVSYPVFKMIESGIFDKTGKKPELIIWNNPDQLRALVAGKQVDVCAMPSNVGAMFYNKNIDIKLLNISIWRAIWLVSRSKDKKTLADFKGEEIAMPFKGDMPHLVFMNLARKQGLDPEKDFKIQYQSTPMDAAKKMIMRRVDNALLIDPAVSTVIVKSQSGLTSIIAPDIYRSVDIQNEWGRLYNTANEIPFAGMMAVGKILEDKKLLDYFVEEYKKATEWCMQNPEATAKMVVKYIPQLNEKGVSLAMKNVTLRADDAKTSKDRVNAFYKVLLESKPALVGGKLPDDGYYYQDIEKVEVQEETKSEQ